MSDHETTQNLSDLTIDIHGTDPIEFFGVNNTKINALRKAFPRLKIVARGSKIKAAGSSEQLGRFKDRVDAMLMHLETQGRLTEQDILDMAEGDELPDGFTARSSVRQKDVLVYGPNGNNVRARTPNQKLLVQAAADNDILFAIGPAGTGKTYTAVALAIRALKERTVQRIILTRPAVEAGENLGFLPGDLKEKIDPYLRPLYDALDDMIHPEKLRYYMENRIIEVAPLAFMRGRTLDKAFIILDEAQNATLSQLKMFLTRIGPNARCIITGDLTQIDLPRRQHSGLRTALDLLDPIEGIDIVHLDHRDVIRHALVGQIIRAFDQHTDDNDTA